MAPSLAVCAPHLSVQVLFGPDALDALPDVQALVDSSPEGDDLLDLISSARVGLAVAWSGTTAVGFACGAYVSEQCTRLVRLGVADGLDAGVVIRALSEALDGAPWDRAVQTREKSSAPTARSAFGFDAWRGSGAWAVNHAGRRVLDARAGLSGTDLGYCHAALARSRAALRASVARRRTPSTSVCGRFARELAALCRMDLALPMPTPADALLVAVGLARENGCAQHGIPEGLGEVLRVTTSDIAPCDSRTSVVRHVQVPFGDLDALEAAVSPRTVAVVVQPLPVRPRLVVPDDEYLPGVRELCDRHGLLMVADESASGLARSGAVLACELHDVRPDLVVLGPCLGAGLVSVGAVVGRRDRLVGSDISALAAAFPVDPLVCAIGRVVVRQLGDHDLPHRAAELGYHLALGLASIPGVSSFRCRGLWASLELAPGVGTATELQHRLARAGVLVESTAPATLTIAPPLVASELDIEHLIAQLRVVLSRSEVSA